MIYGMLDSPAIIEEINSSLKASLHRGRQHQDLDQDVVAASKRVLLEHIEFEQSKAPYTMQLDQLRSKYISLNAGAAATPSLSRPHCSGDASQHAHSSNGPTSSSPSNSGDSLPLPKVILYPEEGVRMEWLRQGRIGAGLVNMGNTCFFNSTLQCLTYTAPLVNYCFSNDHKQKCSKNGFCMMCEIQDHIRTSLNCGGKSIKPHSILQKLRCIAKHMKWGRQEDAHEFLRFVIDHLQQACLNGHSKLDRFSKETTVVNQIFGGYLQSQVTCLRCQAKSNTFDPFMDLSLDIKNVNTVEEALMKFVKPETLDHDNAYKCPKCKHKVRAQKRFSIHRAPNVLTLQLNRFDFHRQFSGKINRFIRYTEKINLRHYMSQRQGEPILYHLYGVLVHSGSSSDCGHYYSFVKSPSKIWYCMNDSMVHQAGSHAVLSADAYVLFYARINKSPSIPSHKNSVTGSSNHTNKTLNTPTKGPFIGPVIPSNLKQSSPRVVNGLHGTPSSEQGTPIKRQHPTMLPRSLQTNNGSKVLPNTLNNSNATTTTITSPEATASSTLPGSHGHISFAVLSHQQKRQQQQKVLTGEDGKRIVLQIKHGNSTTMEKSPDGKAQLVANRSSDGGKNDVAAKPGGLVPYCDDDDGDSDSDQGVQTSSSSNVDLGKGIVTAGTDNVRTKKGSQSPLPLPPPPKPNTIVQGSDRDTHLRKQNYQQHKGAHLSHEKSSTLKLKTSAISAALGLPTSSLPCTQPLSKPHEDRKLFHSNGLHGSASSLSSPGKAGAVVPLELPVFSVSASPSSVVKTASGAWHVHPQDTGAPSPRGSCSSANSVNSTTEWTLQSKDQSNVSKPNSLDHHNIKNEHSDIVSSQQRKSKPEWLSYDVGRKGNDKSLKPTNQLPSTPQISSSSLHKAPVTSPSPALVRPEIPVDISDRQSLLSSPHSSQTSEGSRKSKKHKKQKHRQRSSDDEEKRIHKKYSNGWADHGRPSSQEFREKQKLKRHKHRKDEKRKRHESSDSDREDSKLIKRGKKRYSSSDSDSSSGKGHKKHKMRKQESEDEDNYEWIEVTKDTTTNKNKASVQSWDHHIKDDLASRKEMEQSRPRSTWDGSRVSKVASALRGSSQSLGSSVLSWDGGKNQVDKELQAEHTTCKRNWSEDYNQELDTGKVKKTKKHKYDDDFHGGNRFQMYQSGKTRDKDRDMKSTWSQDHSYHQRHDHKNNNDRSRH